MRIDRWINSNEEFSPGVCLASCDGMQRGAGRGCHSRVDLGTHPGSYQRAADRDSHASANPGAYLDFYTDSGRDRHPHTDFDTHSDHGAGRLLACKQ